MSVDVVLPRRHVPRAEVMHDSGSARVLLIDDSPEIRLLFGRFLRESGMAVTFAEDGLAALAHARTRA